MNLVFSCIDSVSLSRVLPANRHYYLRSLIVLLVLAHTAQHLMAAKTSSAMPSSSALLLDTSMFPSQQEWFFSTDVNGSSQLGGPLVESLAGSMYEMSTIGVDGPSGSPGLIKGPMHFWGKDSGIPAGAAFNVEFSLQVIATNSNPFDAGIGFSLAMTSPAPSFFFDRYMRDTMIVFEEDRIGFGDLASTFAVDTLQLNDYRISVTENNHLLVHVNDILALNRPDFLSTGIVGFGDSTNDIGFDGHFLISSITLATPEPTSILLDIKPGSSPNSVNLGSRGVLPVAIFSTDDFDVHDVDIDTLLFGDPLLLDNGGTAISPLRSSYEDISGDGLLDLALKFSTADLVDLEALGPDTIEGFLTGALLDGTPIEGMDSIRIVPPNGPKGNNHQNSVTVPEPTTSALASLGLIGLLANGSRRRRES